MKMLNILLSLMVLLFVSGCNEKSEIDISHIMGKTEEHFKQLAEVDTVATSFDGKKDINFRMMVEGTPTEEQAQILFNEVLMSFEKYSNQSELWDDYNGYFDIKNDNGVVYEASKIIGEELKIISK